MSPTSIGKPVVLPAEDARRLAALRRPSLSTLAGAVIVVSLIIASGVASEVSPVALLNGVSNVIDFLGRMFPPDFSELGRRRDPDDRDIGIAIFGTAVGALLAIPLGLLAPVASIPSPGFTTRCAYWSTSGARCRS